jgi:hypothetical protein
MPLLDIVTSATLPPAATTDALLQDLSREIARLLGKPEAYVVTSLAPRARVTFAGTFEPACYVEIKNIGVFSQCPNRQDQRRDLHAARGSARRPADRIYIEFANVEAHLWGYDGGTFA